MSGRLSGAESSSGESIFYTYDKYNRATKVKSTVKNGSEELSYTYDALNQLKTVTRGTDVWAYTYDNGGNLTSVTKNGTTVKTYGYEDTTWKDLLTTYNGQTLTYDNIGNPLTYRDGYTFTWQNGRQLAGLAKGSDTITYQYNDSGIRTQKTVNGVATDYYWLNGTLLGQKTGDNLLTYLYDENGTAYGITYNGTYYYYIFNAQGDVTGILDGTGAIVALYDYDAWGNILAITDGSGTDISQNADHIGNINPLRYRGYQYDAESGLYYVMSRYYDAEVGRWINVDGQISGIGGDITGYNLFVYCCNNMVNKVDSGGNKPGDLFDTMDEAAKDFAKYINAKSINENREYASYIYKQTITETRTVTYMNPIILGNTWFSRLWNSFFRGSLTKTVTIQVKVTKYTYREPKRGTAQSSSPPVNWLGAHTVVGRIHTHAAYDASYANDMFSLTDKRIAKRKGMITYVATPVGTLRKYDPSNNTDIVLFDDIPYDPNHPERK